LLTFIQIEAAMNIRARLTPEETADRILSVAEEHFRRVGYAKTAVADIAAELGMSSANVYRFFPSKSAINEAICSRMLAECHVMMRAIVDGPGSASARLRALLLAMHDYNARCYTAERRMHDMVEAAMEENWSVIQDHLTFVVEMCGKLAVEGAAAGEFRPVADPRMTGLLIKQSCTCILHPLMIAERDRHNMNTPGHAEALVDFTLSALKA
jgi:AcrR family transcriptional regulator